VNGQRLDEQELRSKSTAELIRHALEEAKLLAKAEVIHAKQEMKEELKGLKLFAILTGISVALGLCALSALFVALGLLIPLPASGGVAVVGAGLLVIAALVALVGWRKLPKKPLPRTQERLRQDYAVTRERLA
jgi:4-hydroxybenzoate polyprenyltransferase